MITALGFKKFLHASVLSTRSAFCLSQNSSSLPISTTDSLQYPLFSKRNIITQARSVFPLRGVDEFFHPRVVKETPQKTKEEYFIKVGRAWKASELRLKSFDDLHKLWYVLLKERNMLLTERERLDNRKKEYSHISAKLHKVAQSMARLKTVLRERERLKEYAELSKQIDEKRQQILDYHASVRTEKQARLTMSEPKLQVSQQ
eukprot:TRINITY_DN5429_c0_g1_i1.p1 TRINITY_DN5429_c0_g1~~TRINITY_DN5429_c0_g1_i1.p1  ORF type:complete len:203 (+),score=29.54 TRINITY_DN5429_c0_g1_i1:48-656(+)